MSSMTRIGQVVAGLALATVACATPKTAVGEVLRSRQGGFEVEVLVGGAPVPTFFQQGETYVLGQLGDRYTLRIWNRTGRRVEAVASVDGRDVVEGRNADFRRNRGYLVMPWSFVDIEGWRISGREVAAFRFSSVADSYAARMGSARNVGVVGVAIFPERPPVVRRPPPPPFLPEPGDWRKHKRSYDEEAAPAAPSASADGARGAPRAEATAPEARQRPGLGTEFGEAMTAPVREVPFVRQNPGQPAVVLGVRYNDRAGLLAVGIDVDRIYYGSYGYGVDEGTLRRTADPFPAAPRPYAPPPSGWRRY